MEEAEGKITKDKQRKTIEIYKGQEERRRKNKVKIMSKSCRKVVKK
jgi:hypothetical protein